MNQTTTYRYEAKNDKSYYALAAYVIDLNTNVSLFPGHRVIILDDHVAESVDKFINKNGLDVYISPINLDDENIGELINTETVDSGTLHKIAHLLLGRMDSLTSLHKQTMAEAKRDIDMYRKLYQKQLGNFNRVRDQIQAITVLLNAIFPEK